MGPLRISDGWIEKNLKLIHLVAPLISQPSTGTRNKSKKKEIAKIFNNFLRLLTGNKLKKNKIDKENIKKIVCLNKRVIEYSVPVRE